MPRTGAHFKKLPLRRRQLCSPLTDLKCHMYQTQKGATGKEKNLFQICCLEEVLGNKLYKGMRQFLQKGVILMSRGISTFSSSIWFLKKTQHEKTKPFIFSVNSVQFSKFSISIAAVSLLINCKGYRC